MAPRQFLTPQWPCSKTLLKQKGLANKTVHCSSYLILFVNRTKHFLNLCFKPFVNAQGDVL